MAYPIRGFTGVAGAAWLLAACAGSTPNPIATTSPADSVMTCEIMHAEIGANVQRARGLMEQKANTERKNAAAFVGGMLLAWPILLAMDLSERERVEMEGLRSRNEHLARLMRSKGCATIPPTSPEAEEDNAIEARIKAAEAAGKPPNCKEVGGYEAYKRKTGNVCAM